MATDSQIRTLRTESAQAGDHAQVLICDLALGDVVIDEDTTLESLRIAAFLSASDRRRIAAMGEDECREECARVIADAFDRASAAALDAEDTRRAAEYAAAADDRNARDAAAEESLRRGKGAE